MGKPWKEAGEASRLDGLSPALGDHSCCETRRSQHPGLEILAVGFPDPGQGGGGGVVALLLVPGVFWFG